MKRLFLLLVTICHFNLAHAVDVYQSPADDGAGGPEAAIVVNASPVSLNLYINKGPLQSAPGKKCSGAGTGDEICGWDLLIRTTGGMVINSFVPGGDVIYTVHGGTTLRANAISAVNPPAGPVKMGVLNVSATASGKLETQGNKAITSLLTPDPIIPKELARTLDFFGDMDLDGDIDGKDLANFVASPGKVKINNLARYFGFIQ